MKQGSKFIVFVHKNISLSTNIKKACPNIINQVLTKELIRNSANQIKECC